ncbi:unnamed protein product [Macrosiphum euphorbiae]|uniref:Uncharacterized protein n=1 Tax=Macrosiphum euphorbiae TaxID=13131 RepID=A0AAV0XRK7_9HEMI|nr:unnamed protein product [Macrosiphum euphorbiae]
MCHRAVCIQEKKKSNVKNSDEASSRRLRCDDAIESRSPAAGTYTSRATCLPVLPSALEAWWESRQCRPVLACGGSWLRVATSQR